MGNDHKSQILEIIKILGTPTQEDLISLNKAYANQTLAFEVVPHPLEKIFPTSAPESALTLIRETLVYNPNRRPEASDILTNVYFNGIQNIQEAIDLNLI